MMMQQKKIQQKQGQQNQSMQMINGNISQGLPTYSRGKPNPPKKLNNFQVNPSLIEDNFSLERAYQSNIFANPQQSKRIKVNRQKPQSYVISPNLDLTIQQQFLGNNQQQNQVTAQISANPLNSQQNIKKPIVNATIKQFFGKVKNLVTKFAFATRLGFIPNNPYKINQDSFILAPNLLNQLVLHYFGVCVGHGQQGKEVSNYVKTFLSQNLDEEIKNLVPNIHQSIKNSFIRCYTELPKFTPVPLYSVTTCCKFLLKGTKVYSANSGDSRAIIVNKFGKAKQLSRDHKPNDDDESIRINERGGRIETIKDYMTGEEMGPKRVSLMNQDVPRLAISKSLGDYVAQSVCVIPNPEIYIQNSQLRQKFILNNNQILEYEICPDDLFMIIASDGQWEFMPNEDVAKISLPFYQKNAPEAAANALVLEAYIKWKLSFQLSLLKQEEEVIDDKTCKIVFFEGNIVSNSLKAKQADLSQTLKIY